jgi:dipeptidyl aminopeptidase/acylaminoacyl peptidase
MQSRKVYFYSEGSRLEGDYYLPDDIERGGRRAGLVLCNGFSALKKIILPDYARIFADAGYCTLGFDYRGFGGSEGTKWRIIPVEQLQDIRNAVTWLEAQPEVDPAKLGLWGTSNGGAHVICAAAADPRVKCIVGQVGFGDGARLLTDHYSPTQLEFFRKFLAEDRRNRVLTGKGASAPPGVILNSKETQEAMAEAVKYMPEIYCEIPWESAEEMLDYRPLDVVHKIAPRPLMLIGADHDTVCAPEDYRSVFERAGEPKRWHSFPVRHYDLYVAEWVQRAGRLAVEWFAEHLRSTS